MPQSLLITGPEGIGLISAVRYIAEKLNIKPLIINPEYEEKVDLEKGIISVDIVRRLRSLTKSKSKVKMVVFINNAERMNIPAQNAFLKLLEEPGDNIHFVLLSTRTSVLLPTVLSRLSLIELRPLTKEQTIEYLRSIGMRDEEKLTQLLFIASGLPEELYRLATDEDYFNKRVAIVRDARIMLQGDTYQKLLIGNKYKNDREGALIMINDAMKQLQLSMANSRNVNLVSRLDVLLNVYERIAANGNIRLQLASMV